MYIENLGLLAREAEIQIAQLSTEIKNEVLLKSAEALLKNSTKIIEINKKDVEKAKESGVKDAFIDRLTLTEKRIKDMADGLKQIVSLNDPVGEFIYGKTLPNGLIIQQKRVPLGVVAIIFESRPNVTADAFGLCLKSGNAVILRGGKEAINTNIAIVKVFKEVLKECNLNENAIQIVENTSHEIANELMKAHEYIDVLIPRGSSRLINTVINNSTIPCIQTGVGNCHIFVDESGKLDDAINIIINAKTQRPGVCNAVETLLIHKNIAKDLLPNLGRELISRNVEIRGDETVRKYIENSVEATKEDWATEYEDYIVAIKIVEGLDEAIKHIAKYGTKHSECIVTENYSNAQRFLNEIDAAAVYINASTRFTDGGQFGFGAEIGISTQKLHARGPMGLKELTTTKYVIMGNGQVRK
ncbi:glutamate-5-semialdehyde dehydrogenase [Fusobacterium perfoetens]|uniref:glutamate-5-semialdehyde dehydrogenase n=1 Tax=Fusobacterium perfoetens TaxID=852 RepID=UPI0004858FF6|nr:glutamate-5-semialdehyde dehydrogenase [Fusobacterium perfoetens]MCI6152074.1 glutamate-5-semialdehyde dehydrogenase [Fusobacterium perfoetens]MDY3238035.1 glutamate-5-semialdehyde dehydrogenase [Fusobacterium perfoetens]